MNDVLKELKSVLSSNELPNNDDLKRKFQRLYETAGKTPDFNPGMKGDLFATN